MTHRSHSSICYMVGDPHASLAITFTIITTDSQEVSITVRIQNIDEFQMQVVRDFELHSGDTSLHLRWDEGDPRVSRLTYAASGSGALQQGEPTMVGFLGLLPLLTTREKLSVHYSR